MMNNAVLRSVRYMLGLSDAQMVEIIKLGGCEVTRGDMAFWLKKRMSRSLSPVSIE